LGVQNRARLRRACNRFALVAAAGELATEFGITGWARGEADAAVGLIFQEWLSRRGTVGDLDIEAGIRQVRAFIEAHGRSRFEAVWNCTDNGEEPSDDSAEHQHVRNRAGFRKLENNKWQYFVLPQAWKNDLAKGYDASVLAKAMIERGLMHRGRDGRSSILKNIPGHEKTRVYHLPPSILSDTEAVSG